MAFLETLQYIFKSIFSPHDPEILKKTKIKNVEQSLSSKYSDFYKKGFLQNDIAYTFFELYKNAEFFREILEFIDNKDKILIKKRIYDALIYTGFESSFKEKINSLSFENRKNQLESEMYSKLEFKNQVDTFGVIQQELSSTYFLNIEETIQNLELFYDLCSYKYIDMLSNFNNSVSLSDLNPHFLPQKVEALLDELQSFYYVRANVVINAPLARLITAIVSLMPEKSKKISDELIQKKLKKIATIINKILSTEFLKSIITIANNGTEPELKAAICETKVINDFLERKKANFDATTRKLELEHQNNQRLSEIQLLFEEKPLISLTTYNDEINKFLLTDTTFSFVYLQPCKIVKTFNYFFLCEQIKALLNDILLEGLFAVPTEKTDFSTSVYDALKIEQNIKEFEEKFSQGKCFDSKILVSYIQTSKTNYDNSRLLGNLVTEINSQAKILIEESTNVLYVLFKEIVKIFDDAKKISPTNITNIRMILASLRNKEAKDELERNLNKWKDFFVLMKHYIEIKSTKK